MYASYVPSGDGRTKKKNYVYCWFYRAGVTQYLRKGKAPVGYAYLCSYFLVFESWRKILVNPFPLATILAQSLSKPRLFHPDLYNDESLLAIKPASLLLRFYNTSLHQIPITSSQPIGIVFLYILTSSQAFRKLAVNMYLASTIFAYLTPLYYGLGCEHQPSN